MRAIRRIFNWIFDRVFNRERQRRQMLRRKRKTRLRRNRGMPGNNDAIRARREHGGFCEPYNL